MRTLYAMLPMLLMAVSVRAESITIATFADPAADETTTLFVYDAAAHELSGGWDAPGLTLETVSGVYENVTFSMLPVFIDGFGEADPGVISFFDDNDDPIFTISFGSAHLSIIGFGATEFLATDDIVFSGSILPLPVFAESFSFAFANQTAIGGNGSYSVTASFTSSGELVPEPTSLALLGLGGWVAWRRRRESR